MIRTPESREPPAERAGARRNAAEPALGREWDVIIVGGGVAGYTAAKTLAEEAGPKIGPVLLIGGEDRVPYKRTKISKHIAAGFGPTEFELAERSWYDTGRVKLLVGVQAVGIDPEARTLELETGERLSWNRLLLATGSDPVLPEIPEEAAELVRVVRTADQVERLRESLSGAGAVLTVGLGVLGVEVTEQVVRMGKRVVFAGRDRSLMPRQLTPAASKMLEELLLSNGVELKFERTLDRLTTVNGTLFAEFSSPLAPEPETVQADLAVFCLGTLPSTLLARKAGLTVNRGIVVDSHLRTSHPAIWAAGDAAEHPGGLVTGLWHAAELQGTIAALNIAGTPVTYDRPPFRLKCEVFDEFYFSIGKPEAADYGRYTTVEDDIDRRRRGRVYRCFYYRDGRLSGVVMTNDRDRAKLYVQAVREGWSEDRVNRELFP